MSDRPVTGAVVIGRNEGERLSLCLASVVPQVAHVVYVDSGSTDDSLDRARAAGAQVVLLDTTLPFTAARARNAGLAALTEGRQIDYVQFVDGDCVLHDTWVDAAATYLDEHTGTAVTFGRLRERFPDATVYNRLCDWEWNTPPGVSKSCGGIAMMRVSALEEVDGFDPALIAGEEPELCVRLRGRGWRIWRLDHEMALHDAAMTRFGQFWKRARRAGHAFAEGAAMHGHPPERHYVRETRKALQWGLVLPLLTLALAVAVTPWALLLVLLFPLQVVRLALRDGGGRDAWERALLLVAGKFAEMTGVLEYWARRILNRRGRLIEYK